MYKKQWNKDLVTPHQHLIVMILEHYHDLPHEFIEVFLNDYEDHPTVKIFIRGKKFDNIVEDNELLKAMEEKTGERLNTKEF